MTRIESSANDKWAKGAPTVEVNAIIDDIRELRKTITEDEDEPDFVDRLDQYRLDVDALETRVDSLVVTTDLSGAFGDAKG